MRISRRYFWLPLLIWIAVAVIANALAAHWKSDTSSAAASLVASSDSESLKQVDQNFPGTGTDNVASLVLEGDSAAIKQYARSYLDHLAQRLRRDTRAVRLVLDMSSDPLTAPLARSADGRGLFVQVYLRGTLGSREGATSATEVSDAVRAESPPAGMHLFMTGPAATAATRDTAVNESVILVVVVVLAAAAALVLAVVRSLIVAGVVMACAGLAVAIAVPVQELLGLSSRGAAPGFALSLTIAVSVGVSLDYTATLCGSCVGGQRGVGGARHRRSVRRTVLGSAAILAALFSMTRILNYPELHEVALVAATAAAAAALLAVTVTAGFIQPLSRRMGPPRIARIGWRTRIASCSSLFRYPNQVLAVFAVIIAVGATSLVGIDISFESTSAGLDAGRALGARAFSPGRLSPQTVVVVADHDLRNPRGLLAVDRLTRRLMALPTVRFVQSAAWPAGLPWNDATLAHQLGDLNRKVQSDGLSAGKLGSAITQLPATVAQLRSSVNQLQQNLSRGADGLSPLNTSLATLNSRVADIAQSTDTMWHFVDPIRGWMAGFQDCPGDLVCSQALKVMAPIDNMHADMSRLNSTFSGISGELGAATTTVNTAARTLSDMQNALSQMTPAVDGLASSVKQVSNDLTQITAFLNVMTDDLSRSGAGDFYLSQEAIDAPSYQAVKQLMFSADGHAARLFVYCGGEAFAADSARVAAAVPLAVVEATKYGPLANSTMDTVGVGTRVDTLHSQWWAHLQTAAVIAAAVIALGSAVVLGSLRAGFVVAVANLAGAAGAAGVVLVVCSWVLRMQIYWTVPMSALLVVAIATNLDALLLARRVMDQVHSESHSMADYYGGRSLIGTILVWAVAVAGWSAAANPPGFVQLGLVIAIWLTFSYLSVRVVMIAAVSLLSTRSRVRPPRLSRSSTSGAVTALVTH